MQRVVDKGVRDAKWLQDVEGTYMRLDIPRIVPHLLEQLEERKEGQLLRVSISLLFPVIALSSTPIQTTPRVFEL